MSAVIAWVLDHWKAVGLAVAVTGCVTLYVSWLQAHDELVRIEAVAEERLKDLAHADSVRATVEEAYRKVVEETTPALSRLDSLRRTARARHDTAETQAHEASRRLTEAGDSLAATLDSLHTVVPPDLEPLTRTAQRQHREEQAAQNQLVTALQGQLAATQDMLAASDSTNRLLTRRYGALKDAYEARGEALQEAREAVEAMTAGQEGRGIGRDLVAAGIGVGTYVLVTEVVVPVVGGT